MLSGSEVHLAIAISKQILTEFEFRCAFVIENNGACCFPSTRTRARARAGAGAWATEPCTTKETG